jgi:hypothetical protein
MSKLKLFRVRNNYRYIAADTAQQAVEHQRDEALTSPDVEKEDKEFVADEIKSLEEIQTFDRGTEVLFALPASPDLDISTIPDTTVRGMAAFLGLGEKNKSADLAKLKKLAEEYGFKLVKKPSKKKAKATKKKAKRAA